MNVRQKSFVLEYLKDRNATQAAIRAGYSARTARQIGHRLLTKIDIRSEVERIGTALLDKLQHEVWVTNERLLVEVARGAFFDVRKLLAAEGNPLPLHELDDATAAAIAGMEVVTESKGDGEERTVTTIRRYKLADRRAWVDTGLKLLGAYEKHNEQANAANPLAALLRDMGRSALPVVHQVDDELV